MNVGDIVPEIPDKCPFCGETSGYTSFDFFSPCSWTFSCQFTIDIGHKLTISHLCEKNNKITSHIIPKTT